MKSTQMSFDHRNVEKKWISLWREMGVDIADIDGANRPFYNLMMFPYPSAEGLHVGNMYAFTGSDIYGRYKRMQGYDVFEPIGLDGFGIHSENYALKIGRHPMDHATVTQKNFYTQLHKIGSMYDWSRTVETYDPGYYRWTQWLFVQMFKHRLAYRSKASVNYCPGCKTVLADEQVLPAGRQVLTGTCERCGNHIEKRLLEQWFFKITAYAEKLLENISALKWSEIVKTAQRNWIGKKVGVEVTYPVVDVTGKSVGSLSCFTTRPDTNFGATFVVLAPEHPFVNQIVRVIKKEQADEIRYYLQVSFKKSEQERLTEGKKKTGVKTGLYCINQLNGCKMPLYISDFVLMSFGTGAVVGVPGHDKRDFEFAKAFDIPIIRVVTGQDGDSSPITRIEQVQEEEGVMINSGPLDGLDIHRATEVITESLVKHGWGKRTTTYHLRDWLVCRQRYWGPPTPMIYCEACAKNGKSWFTSEEAKNYQSPSSSDRKKSEDSAGWYPVPEEQLPVLLPRIEDYKPGDDGVAPLAKHKEFYETTCPGCGGKAVRETDVSDTFLDSSWYFLRYPSTHCAHSKQVPFDKDITKKWLPVHMYTGGAEHSVLHLLYSRFVTMALHDWGYLEFEEPFAQFYAHGLLIKDGAKISKSKGNVINPDKYIEMYGSDALRLYLMFMGPFNQGGDFRDSAMEGMSRWVGRVWRMADRSIRGQGTRDRRQVSERHSVKDFDAIEHALSKLIIKVADDIEKRRYNTAIASMMEFTNLVADTGGILPIESLKKFILILSPFAPFLTEELWQIIHSRSEKDFKTEHSVHRRRWPEATIKDFTCDSVLILVQVNGKLRDKFTMPANQAKNQTEVEQQTRARAAVQKYLTGAKVTNVIFVPGKIINFVL